MLQPSIIKGLSKRSSSPLGSIGETLYQYCVLAVKPNLVLDIVPALYSISSVDITDVPELLLYHVTLYPNVAFVSALQFNNTDVVAGVAVTTGQVGELAI
jgi:hypothetical protein